MLKINIVIIRFCQIFLWLFSKFLSKYVLDINTYKSDLTFSANSRIVISNHITHLDPFIFIGSLTWTEMNRIRPIRPMIGRWYYHSPLLPLAFLIGCYPAKPLHPILKKYSGTSAAIKYAKNGCTLGIYPEGQRIRGEEVAAKYGVVKILENLKQPDVILCHISKDTNNDKKYYVAIKNDPSVAELRDPEAIMDKVFALGHTK